MLDKLLNPHADRAYALLRIMTGAMFAFHGVQKIFGILSKHQHQVGSQIWIGGLIELVAGVAIAIGVFTSWAAFLSSGTMAVAYFQFHWKFQFDSQIFPAINKGELAVLYCFVFLMIACRGGGLWSVDGLIASKRSRGVALASEDNTSRLCDCFVFQEEKLFGVKSYNVPRGLESPRL